MTRVLIVDDDRWQAEFYERELSPAGNDVHHAAHALAAIEMVDEVQPDVIILDVLLPGTNGIALLHELQTHSDTMTIPVIIVTTLPDAVANTRAYGVHAVFDKSTIVTGELAQAVKKVVRGGE